MKNFYANESRTGLDRLATLDEVRSAMAFSSQSASEPDCTPAGDHIEVDAAGRVGGYAEKLTWLALLSEALYPKGN